MSSLEWIGEPGNEYGKLRVRGVILLSAHVHDNGNGWTWGVWSAHPSVSAIASGTAVTREHAHSLTAAAVEEILRDALGGASRGKTPVQP